MLVEAGSERSEADLDRNIAQAAVRRLRERTGEQGPILLSTLGNQLSSELGPLRQLLGRRTTLRKILEAELGAQVSFEGVGNRVSVSLVSDHRDETPRERRFDKTFWAAFAKPVAPGTRRFLRPSRPFDFEDVPAENAVARPGWLEVEAQRVPPADTPRRQRNCLIMRELETWCGQHDLAPDVFVDRPQPSDHAGAPGEVPARTQSAPQQRSNPRPPGIDALLRLIEAVPRQERSKFSLPLDLIQRLIAEA